MEDTNRIFSAEQIVVPPDLPKVLKEWTKEVIRANPADVLAFSAEYFAEKSAIANRGKISEAELANMRRMFDKYDTDGNGHMETSELRNFITIDLEYDISDSDLEKVIALLDKDASGVLEFEDRV